MKTFLRLLPFVGFEVLAGALAMLVGGAVLAGWALDIATLRSVLPGWVSMKPNTAVAFVCIGLAALLARPTSSALDAPFSARRAQLARLCGLLAGTIGLLTLAEYAFGWNPGFDQWLFAEPAGAVGTSHPGRMAPDSAVCFALLAAGLEFIRRARESRRTQIAALTLGALVTMLALIEIFSYFTPTLRADGWGGLTMMALPTAVVFAVLGATLSRLAARAMLSAAGAPAQPADGATKMAGQALVLIFVVLSVSIMAAGSRYYRSIELGFRNQVESELSGFADSKVGQLVQWRKERMADAGILFRNPTISALVRRFLENPEDADAKVQLQTWLGKYGTHYGYDHTRLLDAQGVTRLSLPEGLPALSAVEAAYAAEALRSGQVKFQDFYRSTDDQAVRLALLIPVLDEARGSRRLGSRRLGVIVLRIDPQDYLNPLIQSWPTASRSAETLLLRRDGNDALFLNELRFSKNSALNLRASLDRLAMPAVQAVRGGNRIMYGIDYRGVAVVAALRTIPDSPWSLVARQDIAEVNAPLREQLWQVIVMLAVVLLGAGAGVALIWQRQGTRHYREQAQAADALREYRDLLAQAERMGRVGGWEFDVETQRQIWTEMVYEIHELDGTGQPTVAEGINFYTPASRPVIARAVQRAIEHGEPFDVELEIITAKGNLRSVHAVGQADSARRKVSGFFQDITEHKRAAEALFKSAAELEHIGAMARIGGWELDVATSVVTYSRETARIHEVDFPYVPPKLSQGDEYYPPEAWPVVRAAVQAAIEHGTAYDLELPFITAKGRHLWVRVQGFAVQEDGKTIKLRGTFQDITERKEADATIREHLAELLRWQKATLGRENRVLELKQEVNELLARIGEPTRYTSVEGDT